MARCADGTIYVGIARDPARIAMHDAGRGAKYTRIEALEAVLLSRRCATKGDALRLEAAIKRLARPEKLALAQSKGRLAKLARSCAITAS